jgi:hypothetical protein
MQNPANTNFISLAQCHWLSSAFIEDDHMRPRMGSKLVCEAWLIAIGWKSRTRLVVGSVSWTARVSIARWNLKEAVSKRLVQRTETTYKAVCIGWCCKSNKSPILLKYAGGKCSEQMTWKRLVLPSEVCHSAVGGARECRRSKAV